MNKECNICPHKCNVDRSKVKGRCMGGDKIEIGGYSLHMFEEPCISGENGSGTVFFSKCNLSCVFCQNYEISNLGKRKRNRNRRACRYFCSAAREKCGEH